MECDAERVQVRGCVGWWIWIDGWPADSWPWVSSNFTTSHADATSVLHHAQLLDLLLDPIDVGGHTSVDAWLPSFGASLAETDDALEYECALLRLEYERASGVALKTLEMKNGGGSSNRTAYLTCITATLIIAGAQHELWIDIHRLIATFVAGDALLGGDSGQDDLHKIFGSVAVF